MDDGLHLCSGPAAGPRRKILHGTGLFLREKHGGASRRPAGKGSSTLLTAPTLRALWRLCGLTVPALKKQPSKSGTMSVAESVPAQRLAHRTSYALDYRRIVHPVLEIGRNLPDEGERPVTATFSLKELDVLVVLNAFPDPFQPY